MAEKGPKIYSCFWCQLLTTYYDFVNTTEPYYYTNIHFTKERGIPRLNIELWMKMKVQYNLEIG